MTKLKLWSPIGPVWSNNWPWDEDFDDFVQQENPLNLYETPQAVVIEVKCPGFKSKDIQVTLENGVLSIKGDMKEEVEEEEKDKKYYRKEIKQSSFARSVTLPVPVKEEQAAAKFEDGMLVLTLPKAEEAKPKQIKIDVK